MRNITIRVIKHKNQKYETVGNWFYKKNGDLIIEVSDMGDWRYNFLVAFHELAEAMICRWSGVKQADVDAFDIQYEEDRKRGIHGPYEEPGDDEEAPYRMAHFWATTLERTMAALIGVNWSVYDRIVGDL